MGNESIYTKPKRPSSSITTQNKKNPCKFYTHFIFKAIIFIIFLVILPLFPLEPPDFISPSIFTTSWELFHLIFVGIVVSYGLFSRKNDDLDEEKENHSKFDNAQNYMSKFLQVSSVFDDESENPSGFDDNSVKKIETWSSKYCRNQTNLVVAQKGSFVIDDSSRVDEKPLLLPVRSLNYRVCDGEDHGVSRVFNRSNSSPSSSSTRLVKNLETMGRVEEGRLVDGDESRVYRKSSSSVSGKGFSSDSKRVSRTRSEKSRVVVSNADGGLSKSLSRSSSSSRGSFSNQRKITSGKYGDYDDEEVVEKEEKIVETKVLPSPIPWRSRSGRIEFKRDSDDFVSFSLQSPSLEEIGPTRSMKSRSSRSSSSSSSPTKISPTPATSPRKLSPSPSKELESLAKGSEDYGRRRSRLPPPPPPPPPIYKSQAVKSSAAIEHEQIPNLNTWSEPNSKYSTQSAMVGKSVRTVRTNETTIGTSKPREIDEEMIDEAKTEKPERRTAGYNPLSKASFSEFPKETRDFLDQVLVTDDESESDDENYGEPTMEIEKAEEATPIDEGPDVDKKADEFIAKFREQIRLQRIESIKRSTGQLKRNCER